MRGSGSISRFRFLYRRIAVSLYRFLVVTQIWDSYWKENRVTTKKRYSDTAIRRYGNRNLELEPEPRIIYANYRILSLLET